MSALADYNRVVLRVSRGYNLPEDALRGRERDQRTTFGRRVVAICLREMGYSYPEIGEVMRRQHTTILRLCKGYEDSYGRSSYVEASVNKATLAAKEIIAETPVEPREPVPRQEPEIVRDYPDNDREAFERAVADYATMLPPHRDEVWIAYCQDAWPNSWWRQASMWPGGASPSHNQQEA